MRLPGRLFLAVKALSVDLTALRVTGSNDCAGYADVSYTSYIGYTGHTGYTGCTYYTSLLGKTVITVIGTIYNGSPSNLYYPPVITTTEYIR